MERRSRSPYESPRDSSHAHPSTPTRTERRRSIRLGYANAAIWGLGNGLVSSTLVIYLANELGAGQLVLGVAWILAFPKFVGLLRLSAPALIDRLASRKAFCLGCYGLSACLLTSLPVVAAPGTLPTRTQSLIALVTIWSLYHLAEYLGTVALWSWLADLVPRRIRGRFIGVRERWLLVGNLVGMLTAGVISSLWNQYVDGLLAELGDATRSTGPMPVEPWLGYAFLAIVGAFVLAIAILPLARMVATGARGKRGDEHSSTPTSRSLLAPLRDGRYWRLLAFGCSLSFFNGLTQSIQYTVPAFIWGLSLLAMLSLRSTTRLGQMTISPLMGRWVDRFGCRPVMILCQLIVATGPAFYLLASPEAPWWIAGAWIAWIAYAGLNVGLTNLMIKLATVDQRAAYIATYFAITGVAYGVSTLVGAQIVETFEMSTFMLGGSWIPSASTAWWDIYDAMFFVGWIGRTASVLLLFWIIEPGAQPLRNLFRRHIA